jgi:SWI/SNF-related matrix-associated actin-dependent regulator 1 of chromatin subfamily A
MLKSIKSQRYQGLVKIKCKRRILLTGTPLQNNLLELMSVLSFTMPSIFRGNMEVVSRLFRKQKILSNDSFENDLVSQARRIISPFILRRLKDEVSWGGGWVQHTHT